jgi:hypothetical protein
VVGTNIVLVPTVLMLWREFIVLGGSAVVASPLGAWPQQPTKPKSGE